MKINSSRNCTDVFIAFLLLLHVFNMVFVLDQNVPAVAATAVDLVLAAVDLTIAKDKKQNFQLHAQSVKYSLVPFHAHICTCNV